MLQLYLRLLVLACLAVPQSLWAFDHQHPQWAEVLKSYRTPDGLVRYRLLKEDSAKDPNHTFNTYLNQLQTVTESEFESFSEAQRKAFLINAYNAFTLKLVVDHYPVKTIKNIGGFFAKPWTVKFFKLFGGRIQQLDPIEHDILRPHYKDFRIHAAVNCASRSCPVLRQEPYIAESLDAQLDDQMRQWLDDRTRNQFDPKEGSIKISKIFSWYESDFEKWGGGVKQVLSRYGPVTARQALEKKGALAFLDYDWTLNESLL